jgi:hypothetical protein
LVLRRTLMLMSSSFVPPVAPGKSYTEFPFTGKGRYDRN